MSEPPGSNSGGLTNNSKTFSSGANLSGFCSGGLTNHCSPCREPYRLAWADLRYSAALLSHGLWVQKQCSSQADEQAVQVRAPAWGMQQLHHLVFSTTAGRHWFIAKHLHHPQRWDDGMTVYGDVMTARGSVRVSC